MADEYETLHEAYEAWERLKESIVCFGDQIVASMIIDIRGTIMAMAAIVLDVALITSADAPVPLGLVLVCAVWSLLVFGIVVIQHCMFRERLHRRRTIAQIPRMERETRLWEVWDPYAVSPQKAVAAPFAYVPAILQVLSTHSTLRAQAVMVSFAGAALIASEHLMAPLMPSAIIDPRHGNMIPVLIDTQTHIPCRVVFTDGPTITIMPESIFDSIIYN